MTQEINESTQTELGRIDDHRDVVVALGLFIARWSLAEAVLNVVLELVSKADQDIVLGLLAATPSAEGKIRLVRIATIQSKIEDQKKLEIIKSLKALAKLCDERNDICHHAWGATNHGDVVTWDYRQPPNKKLRHRFRTAQNINDLSNRAVEAARDICVACGSRWVNDAVVDHYRLPTGGEADAAH